MMQVAKTLVIGLGSTGANIADTVASRIEWELHDISKAPWVQFLCIETDGAEKSRLNTIKDKDFHDLFISADDFKHLTDNPEIYESIRLSTWIDPATIKKLPGQDISAGVGNIRMLGRLAFLFEPNFKKIYSAVEQRLSSLRDLSENEARSRRGSLTNGNNPEIEFANGGRVRIVVVGTLCGGTCSGLASDFGYFLQSVARPEETISAIFTLPSNKLNSAMQENAERFKKNAYHALVELNHYHLGTKDEYDEIHFPNGRVINTTTFPYNLTYLVMPRSANKDGETQLNRACADRIFIDISVPAAESMGTAINATVFGSDSSGEEVIADRDHRAHVFSTFGLSTVEFPAQQVTEAAVRRLLAYTFKEWYDTSISANDVDMHLEELGLTWDGMRQVLLRHARAGQLEEEINQARQKVRKLCGSQPDKAVAEIEKLRNSFRADNKNEDSIPQALRAVKSASVNTYLERIRNLTRDMLTDYTIGINPLRTVLFAAQERLSELEKSTVPSPNVAQQRVQTSLDTIIGYHHSRLLRLMLLRKKAIKSELPNLEKAIHDEVNARLNKAIFDTLQDEKGARSREVSIGLLKQVGRQISPILNRLDNLRQRVHSLIQESTREADRLATRSPDINGVAIFVPETNQGGTVQHEFERCLRKSVNDPALTWEEARDKVAKEIILALQDIESDVVPMRTPDNDWLRETFRPFTKEPSLPRKYMSELRRKATEPFYELTDVDVLERWYHDIKNPGDHIDKAKDASQKAKPFLDVNSNLAEHGGRSPVPIRPFVLMPNSNPTYKTEFHEIVKNRFRNLITRDSPEKFRVVILEEWFRFPLSGCLAILAENSSEALENARANDFPFFWTRKDIGWTGISRGEIEKTKRAQEVLVVNVLLDLVELKHGAIEVPWKGDLIDTPTRRLSLNFAQATMQLAREGRDIDGRSMQGIISKLDDRAMEAMQKMDGATEHEKARNFITYLADRVSKNVGVGQITGWDQVQIGSILKRYFAGDGKELLFRALQELEPRHQELVKKCFKRKGQPGNKRPFEEDGYYCPKCDGLIGQTEEEAARNGWRCYIHPDTHNPDTYFMDE